MRKEKKHPPGQGRRHQKDRPQFRSKAESDFFEMYGKLPAGTELDQYLRSK
jgi:hypothetical protein